ncbi:FAD-binding protein [Aminobacter aminovorans]|uniref:3-oxosteroid 1-dehydrogenase n=1 Tax=Aminobacter aminovorans TaxID=83263 RepID=A0AAC8YW63_AMIAI|nr:FAD-binding protein [Aminobacter aminovorans]AMS45513.1 Putative 3-oxosteroid 1-dehydrogenase [Aminobacter aminovorans]MBB3708588.1 succinate dehydrogenase/fumarate reductase flavoprotein subunit [Aminobacter aminovorans]
MLEDTYDLIVAGAGAAGMAAAIIAHSKNLKVLIVEKTKYVGGTTSYSGAVAWVPNSRQNRDRGVEDSVALATEYLDNVLGNLPGRDARVAYLNHAPEAFEYIEKVSHLQYFVRDSNSPDYSPQVPGAVLSGRGITPKNFDGRLLGEKFKDLRPPLPELSLFGRVMVDGVDLYHLLHAKRSLNSAVHVLKMLARDVRDRVFYSRFGRGTRLTSGNAAVARLYKTVLDMKIPVLLNAPIAGLLKDGGRVSGVEVQIEGLKRKILASRGVILATGGFPWGKDLRKQHMSDVPVGYSAASTDSVGDGISVAVDAGAKLSTENSDGAFWCPVSVGKRSDGTTAYFPHLMADRSKPGLIAINGAGKRFYNESENYHDFVRAMLADGDGASDRRYFLICDASFVRKYIFGMVPPLARARRAQVRSGYLIEARSLEELADKTGVSRAGLQETLQRYNHFAAKGVDPDFGKGSTAYNRYLGDPEHAPNPCLAPIDKAPFYAIQIFPGDIGTAYGLAADDRSRVLDEQGRPIPGLYACGNDRSSIMGGRYPSGGITIGPALTFAYLAVLDVLGLRPVTTTEGRASA